MIGAIICEFILIHTITPYFHFIKFYLFVTMFLYQELCVKIFTCISCLSKYIKITDPEFVFEDRGGGRSEGWCVCRGGGLRNNFTM